MILRDIVRILPSGAPVAAGTEVKIYREGDDLLLDTVTTDENGMFEYIHPGNPGALRWEVSVGAGKKVHSTRSVLPVADLDLSGLRPLMHMFLDGVVVNFKDALAVTSDGLSMQVEVAPGVATGQGVIYRQDSTEVVTIPPAVSNPRIDTIAVRFYLHEDGDQIGRCELFRAQGTELPDPGPPALIQFPTGNLWETPLADVRVDPGVIGIALGKVTDRRLIAVPFIPDGSITADQLADDVSFGVPQIVEAGKPETTQYNVTQIVTGFGLTVASNGAGSAFILPIYGTTANTVAQGNHSHNPAIKGFHKFGASTVGGSVDNQNEQTITIPAVPTKCFFRVRLRVEGGGGTTASGNLFLKVGGAFKGELFPFQADQGVDSTIEAVGVGSTTGEASIKVAWGIDHTGGSLNVKDGHIEWDIQPER